MVKLTMISIITVCFNDYESLKITKKSVFSQNVEQLEWVIIDGDSKDETVEYLLSLKSTSSISIKWISESDNGIYDAMNKGVALSSSEYVQFLNAGDKFTSSESIKCILGKLKEVSTDILYCGARVYYNQKKYIIRHPKYSSDYVWHSNPANHQATIYKREILLENKYPVYLEICGDYFIDALLYKKGFKDRILDVDVVSFYIGGVSTEKPFKLIKESVVVQRDILNLNIIMIILSVIKRIKSLILVQVLYRFSSILDYLPLSKLKGK